jgi:hypothetical protein
VARATAARRHFFFFFVSGHGGIFFFFSVAMEARWHFFSSFKFSVARVGRWLGGIFFFLQWHFFLLFMAVAMGARRHVLFFFSGDGGEVAFV